MGNFNLKSIWKQTGGTGGSTNLEQRVQAIENGYFKKEGNALQVVRNNSDFYGNIVAKNNGYVDHVDTQAPTSMINKQYLEQQLTTTKNQIRTENNTFTGTNTFTGGVVSHASNEFGTEIKAGFGGMITKFIPEDNSTKTLQFYNTNPTDQRRFNLLVSQPTEAQNPTTKQYVDNKFKYVKKAQATGNITINGNNSYQTQEFTISGLVANTLNDFYIVLTTANVDIGFPLSIQCNNLNYPNQSEVKTISTSNWTNSNVDNWGFIYVGFVQSRNHKFSLRFKNTGTGSVTFNGARVYHRVSGILSDN